MKIFFVFTVGAVFGRRLGNIQMKSFLQHHSVNNSNRQPGATTEKSSFDQLTWLLNQHKSMKSRLSSAKHFTPTVQHNLYNEYFMKYFRGFRRKVDR